MDQANTLRFLMSEREAESGEGSRSALNWIRHADQVVSFLGVERGSGARELVAALSERLAEAGHTSRVVDASDEATAPGLGSYCDFLLVASGSPSAAWHASGVRNVVILTPESVRRSIPALRALRNDCGVDRVEVIVNSVTDAAVARRIFFDVSSAAKSRFGMNLQFLGHCNRRTLLNWNEHATKACLGLIAKRLSGEKA